MSVHIMNNMTVVVVVIISYRRESLVQQPDQTRYAIMIGIYYFFPFHLHHTHILLTWLCTYVFCSCILFGMWWGSWIWAWAKSFFYWRDDRNSRRMRRMTIWSYHSLPFGFSTCLLNPTFLGSVWSITRLILSISVLNCWLIYVNKKSLVICSVGRIAFILSHSPIATTKLQKYVPSLVYLLLSVSKVTLQKICSVFLSY